MKQLRIFILSLLMVNGLYAQNYQVSYRQQVGLFSYEHELLRASQRIPKTENLTYPLAFFQRPYGIFDYRNLLTGNGYTAKITVERKNDSSTFVDRISFVRSGYVQTSYYISNYPDLQVGDTKTFRLDLLEYQNQLLIGRSKKMAISNNQKWWFVAGIDVGFGYSTVSYLTTFETIVSSASPENYNAQGFKLLPIYSLNVQFPIGVQYYWRKHWLIEANFNRNFSVIRPLKKNMGNTFKEHHSQTLFGFGLGYRFDKLPVRKK